MVRISSATLVNAACACNNVFMCQEIVRHKLLHYVMNGSKNTRNYTQIRYEYS
jgi:hypothetical protein